MKRMKRAPRAKIIRRALGLSQEDFAARYHRDFAWSESLEPDRSTGAEYRPEAVSYALNLVPGRGSR